MVVIPFTEYHGNRSTDKGRYFYAESSSQEGRKSAEPTALSKTNQEKMCKMYIRYIKYKEYKGYKDYGGGKMMSELPPKSWTQNHARNLSFS